MNRLLRGVVAVSCLLWWTFLGFGQSHSYDEVLSLCDDPDIGIVLAGTSFAGSRDEHSLRQRTERLPDSALSAVFDILKHSDQHSEHRRYGAVCLISNLARRPTIPQDGKLKAERLVIEWLHEQTWPRDANPITIGMTTLLFIGKHAALDELALWANHPVKAVRDQARGSFKLLAEAIGDPRRLKSDALPEDSTARQTAPLNGPSNPEKDASTPSPKLSTAVETLGAAAAATEHPQTRAQHLRWRVAGLASGICVVLVALYVWRTRKR